jgi:hypothetical protein
MVRRLKENAMDKTKIVINAVELAKQQDVQFEDDSPTFRPQSVF